MPLLAPFANMDWLWSQYGLDIASIKKCDKVWDEIYYPFLNFNGCTAKV